MSLNSVSTTRRLTVCFAMAATWLAGWPGPAQRNTAAADPPHRASRSRKDASVDDWQHRLKTIDPKARHSTELLSELVGLLRNPENSVNLRRQTAMLLARIGKPAEAAVPILAAELDGPHRFWSLKALGLFGAAAGPVVNQLATELRDKDRPVDDAVLLADVLGQIGTSSAISALGSQLLREVSQPQADRALLRLTIVDALALSGPRAISTLPALLRSLDDPKSDVRRSTCQAIGAIGPRAESALDALLERLILDDAPDVQDEAAAAMARLGPVAAPSLTRVVVEGPDDLKWRAARSLAQIKPPPRESVPELRRQFTSRNNDVRLESLEAVYRITNRPESVATTLVDELSNSDRQTSMHAARLLVEIPELPTAAATKLHRLAAAKNSRASRNAREVLRKRTLSSQ